MVYAYMPNFSRVGLLYRSGGAKVPICRIFNFNIVWWRHLAELSQSWTCNYKLSPIQRYHNISTFQYLNGKVVSTNSSSFKQLTVKPKKFWNFFAPPAAREVPTPTCWYRRPVLFLHLENIFASNV